MGSEVIEGYDGYNDNISRSFLFGYAIPFTHTGAKLSYSFADAFAASAMVVNGWDNVLDGNQGKSWMLTTSITPVSGLGIYINYIGGPEAAADDDNLRHMVDAVASYQVTETLKLALNGDFGTDAAPAGDAKWYGVAAYVRVDIVKEFSAALRGEWFSDPDGFRTGTAQDVVEGTLTGEYRPAKGFALRGEFRGDYSTVATFDAGDLPASKKFQPNLLLNAVAYY